MGANHPVVAKRVNNLEVVLQDSMGTCRGSRPNFERALTICRQFLGEDHPQTKLVQELIWPPWVYPWINN